MLKDYLTGKNIILIDKRKILFDIVNFRLIPYTSVSDGLLKIIKIDKIVFENKIYKNVLLGIIDKINIDGVDIILNKYLLEG